MPEIAVAPKTGIDPTLLLSEPEGSRRRLPAPRSRCDSGATPRANLSPSVQIGDVSNRPVRTSGSIKIHAYASEHNVYSFVQHPMPAPPSSTGLTITNPLVLYRALLATKRIDPDPAQHRLAIHLQKLYEHLKDYEPIVQYSHRLNQISRALGSTPGRPVLGVDQNGSETGLKPRGVLSSLFEQKREGNALALTRVLTSHEAALQLDFPRGLMLHGEVGTGKSMLIDLFADCLPNRKKKRWHFTTFMLETMAKLEQLRRSRQLVIPISLGQQEDYSLLWLAREMISTSPILFLDEFQLPDRAASKIITNLMTSFFHLGGVLIATSNRMPDELAKAAGMDFTAPPPSRLDSLGWKFGFGGGRTKGKSEAMFSGQGDFIAFLEVLKSRCEVWEMGSGKDYRRRESELDDETASLDEAALEDLDRGFEGLENLAPGNVGLGYEQSLHLDDARQSQTPTMIGLPRHYFVKPASSVTDTDREHWLLAYNTAQTQALGQDPEVLDRTLSWTPSSMRVYGRNVLVPRQDAGVTSWTFFELCASTLGPADYITLASTYHTVILTDVPVLSLLQKNEARRFITLLDALYEARCKLIITADAGPDDIFFPETTPSPDQAPDKTLADVVNQDAVYAETFSEVYQDATAPFRPNISVYDPGSSSPSEPNYTHSRLAGLFSDDQLEDTPPNPPRRGDGEGVPGLAASQDERDLRGSHRGPDFSRSGIFTGEDERFAYKRARSRLWEMCGARWWARKEEGWWKPVDEAVRRWERPFDGDGLAEARKMEDGGRAVTVGTEERAGASREVDERQDEALFRHGASPFRTVREPPPKISFTHVWGVMKWGKKAGAWGQGVEGLEEREKERGKEKEQERERERMVKGEKGQS